MDIKPPFPVMEPMTVKTVRAYLAEKRTIIVPVGGIEQHGYHLPLRTDATGSDGAIRFSTIMENWSA